MSSPSAMRLKSIDVFRGATIAAMILVNAQFSHEWSYLQLRHAGVSGWTFADTIFPCFLFIVGVSLTLSTASRVARGEDRALLLGHAVRRSLLIFGCGLVIDSLRVPVPQFPFVGLEDHLQLRGTLQTIAVCYLAAFLIYLWTGLRGVILGIIGLNLLYLGLFYPIHRGGTLPSITSVLFGVLAGQFLRDERRPRQWLLWLLGGGIILIAAGELIAIWVPIYKPLWTTSFAIFMSGLATIALAFTIWLVDVRGLQLWFRPLEILGLNAIAAYLISRLVADVPRVQVMGKSLYTDVLARMTSPPNASLLFAMLVLAAVYLLVWFMSRRGWYVKF